MEKLSDDWADIRSDGVLEISHGDEDRIRALLLGRRVVDVEVDHLQLDDGTVIRVLPNEGCGGCQSGWYELKSLARVENMITRVDFECVSTADEDGYDEPCVYRIFVLADNDRINLLTVEGTDGNGYYGTGYELLVKTTTR